MIKNISVRRILFIALSVAVLVAIATVMMVIGRGHTVYFDNVTLADYNGQTYSAPYKVVVYVKGEKVASLNARERGMATWIGQNFTMEVEVTEQKGGEEVKRTIQLALPYSVDGIIVNMPAVLAGLPEEAWFTEFVPAVVEEDPDAGLPVEEDELGMGDDMAGSDF